MSLALVSAEQQTDAPTFDDFWLLYPKRCAKKDARNAWAKLSEQQKTAALIACVNWRGIWATRDTEFLPHPATWLNGERWEDELPSSVSHASHVVAKPQESARGEMPAHVRELLAKMRAR